MTFDDLYEIFCSYYHDDGSNEEIMREILIDAMKKFVKIQNCEHPYFSVYQSDTECYCELCGKDLTLD